MKRARAAVLLALVGALAAGCSSGPGQAASSDAETAASGEGVAVNLPAGWRAVRPYQPPQIPDPVARLALASAPVRTAPRGCQVSAYRIPARAAMVVVLEWRHRGLGPRGRLRRPAAVRSGDLRLASRAIECFGGRGGVVDVGDGHRRWGAYVMLGRRASPQSRADALAIIRSMRATSPPERLPGLLDATNDLAMAGGRLWRASIRTVTTAAGGLEPAHRVEAFDPATLERAGGPIRLPAAWRLAAGPSRLWVTGDAELRLIDPTRIARAGRIRGLDQGIAGLAVGRGVAWAIEARANRLRRIDPASGRVAPRWVRPAPEPISALALDGESLWVTTLGPRRPVRGVTPTPRGEGALYRLDAHSGRVLGATSIGRGASGVAVGFGAVWVLNGTDGNLMRIRRDRPEMTAVVRLWRPVRNVPSVRLALGAGRLWAIGPAGTLWYVDPTALHATRISTAAAGRYAVAVAAGRQGIFVALNEPERICRIAPGQDRLRPDSCSP